MQEEAARITVFRWFTSALASSSRRVAAMLPHDAASKRLAMASSFCAARRRGRGREDRSFLRWTTPCPDAHGTVTERARHLSSPTYSGAGARAHPCHWGREEMGDRRYVGRVWCEVNTERLGWILGGDVLGTFARDETRKAGLIRISESSTVVRTRGRLGHSPSICISRAANRAAHPHPAQPAAALAVQFRSSPHCGSYRPRRGCTRR